MNNNTTNVILQTNNYRIIQKVKGTATGLTVLGFGGSFRPLIENARSEMLRNANLIGYSRAVINETVEINYKYFVVIMLTTINVSAYVIEFTDGNSMQQSMQQYERPQNTQLQITQPQQTGSNFSATQSQTQLRDSQPQQGIQVSGWYFANASNGMPTKTNVMLIVQRRDVGQGFPQYLVLSIDGRSPGQSTVASYDNNRGAYVFQWGNTAYYFTM